MANNNLMQEKTDFRVCTKTVMDSTLPGISFDKNGAANYLKIYEELFSQYPRGEKGKQDWENLVARIKKEGEGKRYDCIIGVSGGTDSSYLMYLTKKVFGLNPLAVYLDNGWSSDISVQNIKKLTRKLKIDLETYVIEYEEVKDILKSYMKAGFPWIDAPTDIAIEAALYLIAGKEKIKFILNGADFRSEGKQPTEWTYSDARQLKFIQKKFGSVPIKTFPSMSLFQTIYYGMIKGIKVARPLYYLDYDKQSAQALLQKEYGWEYYGGHHHENIFTKFAIAYWLPRKFNIDKRKITYTAQILNKAISREHALEELAKPPYDPAQMEADKDYVIKKLGMTNEEFLKIWNAPNKSFLDYPSYFPVLKKMLRFIAPFINLVVSFKPTIITEMEVRRKHK